ncbi:hypothetical protein, partial [Vibrio cincinnatiensis]|uniref:hypothetical protein n=1 Tax=Vibrio cincinnatiensis TaxID=675 RepID=UPI001EDF8849
EKLFTHCQVLQTSIFSNIFHQKYNAALRCELRLAILERSENAKRCESLLNALLAIISNLYSGTYDN